MNVQELSKRGEKNEESAGRDDGITRIELSRFLGRGDAPSMGFVFLILQVRW